MAENKSADSGTIRRIVEQGVGTVFGTVFGTLLVLTLTAIGGLIGGAVAAAWTFTEVPANAVIAFDREGGCPSGWRPHSESGGRFIVGTIGNTPVNDPPLPYGSPPGGSYSQPSRLVKLPDPATTAVALTEDALVLVPGPTDNMPPYVPLWFCTPVN